MKILLFINVKASQAAESYERAEKALTQLGCQVIRGDARSSDEYASIIQAYCNEIDIVVLGGGDGTLQCAAEILSTTKLPMGILPLGTANNVARTLGIPLSIEGACDVIVHGKTISMDLARVNGRFFVSVVGIGFSTEIHDLVPEAHKKRWGPFSYGFQALRALWRGPRGFRVEIQGQDIYFREHALQVTICNGRHYGAHIEVHGEASLSDGLLDISIIEAARYWRGLRWVLMPISRAQRLPGLALLRSKQFEIRTYPPMKMDVEGSTDLSTPAWFEIFPAALQVRVAASSVSS